MPIRERPHRLDRKLYAGNVSVSFTLCIQDKRAAFSEQNIVTAFTEILASIIEKAHCIVPVYCFMPDHLHLLMTGTANDSDLWKAVVSYKQKTGFWFASNKPDIKWQKDFYDHILRADEQLSVHIRYILDNPVRKELVTNWQDYPYTGSIGCDLAQILNGII